jgi:anti-anti-sigma regulatory factor
MDTTKDIIADIKTNEVEDRSILVELSGEFDLGDLESLRTVLDGALSSGLPLWVDLSRVTFFDVRVTRELAVQSHLHGDYL